MPKNSDYSNSDINDILFYHKDDESTSDKDLNNEIVFSNQPSNELSVKRLIDGQPPYIHHTENNEISNTSNSKLKKTLILFKDDFYQLYKEFDLDIVLKFNERLHFLKSYLNFEVYVIDIIENQYYKHDFYFSTIITLIKNKNSFNIYKLNIYKPEIIDIHDVHADNKFFIFNKNSINTVINTSFNKLISFGYNNDIMLIANSICQTDFDFLLKANAHTLKKITLIGCPNIFYINSELLYSDLKEIVIFKDSILRRLGVDEGIYKGSLNLNNEEIVKFLKKQHNLKSINLEINLKITVQDLYDILSANQYTLESFVSGNTSFIDTSLPNNILHNGQNVINSLNLKEFKLYHNNDNKNKRLIKYFIDVTNIDSLRHFCCKEQASNFTIQLNDNNNNNHDRKSLLRIKRIFLNYPPNLVRHQCFDKLNYEDNLELKHIAITVENTIDIKESNISLINNIPPSSADAEYYLGRYNLQLTKEWQLLPSIHSSEIITTFYLKNKNIKIEFAPTKKHGFYAIKLASSENKDYQDISLEWLVKINKKQIKTVKCLNENIVEIINYFRTFVDLPLKNHSTNAKEKLQSIINEKRGVCRHRAIACLHKLQEQNIIAQVITNDFHAYVEVRSEENQQWITCDLGGGYVDTIIDNEQFSDIDSKHISTQENTIDNNYQYQQSFSAYGTKEDKQNKDCTHLSINEYSESNFNISIFQYANLESLCFTNCQLTAKTYNEIFKNTKNLKILEFKDCKFSENSFVQLNFSSLNKIENISISGYFTCNIEELNTVMATAKSDITWNIDNPLLNYTSLNANEDENKSTSITTVIETKKIQRQIPLGRYFATQNHDITVTNIIKNNIISQLINTNNPYILRYQLNEYCIKNEIPVFYVENAEEISCSRTIIKKIKVKDRCIGQLCKGPGGALYNFIEKYKQADISCKIIINYQNFSASDIVKYNSILDEESKIDGVSLPSNFQIIGLLNKNNPQAYQGADFYSRFKEQHDLNISESNFILPIHKLSELEKDSECIELNNDICWQGKLLGSWKLQGQQLIWQEGQLIRALNSSQSSQIIINNPPKNDTFQRFWQDLILYNAVFDNGEVICEIMPHKEIVLREHEQIPGKDNIKISTIEEISSEHCILNNETLTDFFGKYELNDEQQIHLQPGLLKINANETLKVLLTHSLTKFNWMKLMEAVVANNVQLEISCSSQAKIPQILSAVKPTEVKLMPKYEHTQLFTEKIPYFNIEDIVIDISELDINELLTSIDGKFIDEKLEFVFNKKIGFLIEKLAEDKKIILTGHWSKTLALSLLPLIFQRLQNPIANGQLFIFIENSSVNYFSSIMQISNDNLEIKSEIKSESELMDEINITTNFQKRLKTVEEVLSKQPLLWLSGETGVGKTSFIEKIWKINHPILYYGENSIVSWLTASTDDNTYITLFLDEANLEKLNLTKFNGLYNLQPAIFYQGKYYKLSKKHRVIFAGNPQNYGGERQDVSKLKNKAIIHFQPIPIHEIVKTENLSSDNITIIDKVATSMLQHSTAENFITPREIIMAVNLARVSFNNNVDTKLSFENWLAYFMYYLCLPHVCITRKKAFIEECCPKIQPEIFIPKLNNFILNNSNRSALIALTHHLNLRSARIANNDLYKSGLGGLIFEGEPGIGKSTLIIKFLTNQNIDFYHIPVSLNIEEKIEKLLTSFHSGKIAIIDEINSSPMLERLLNALLEGHDLDNNSAENPGFLLIGTQNPANSEFKGRVKTTLPLQHRLHTIILEKISEQEMLDILIQKNIPYIIANDITKEFQQLVNSGTKLCMRDVLNIAEQWQKSYQQFWHWNIELVAAKQIGETCKLTAIENIEKHFSTKFNYPTVPLRKDSQYEIISIRYIAKKIAKSMQGEILEFNNWQKIITALGYESTIIDFTHNFNIFLQNIIQALQNDDLLMLCFPVSKKDNLPDLNPNDPEKVEHAAVINGYNAQQDSLQLTYYQNTWDVDAVTLFNSQHNLKNTRTKEKYRLNPQYEKFTNSKYVFDLEKGNIETYSPTENSGFRGKLLIVKNPNKKLERNFDEYKMYKSSTTAKRTSFTTCCGYKNKRISVTAKRTSFTTCCGYKNNKEILELLINYKNHLEKDKRGIFLYCAQQSKQRKLNAINSMIENFRNNNLNIHELINMLKSSEIHLHSTLNNCWLLKILIPKKIRTMRTTGNKLIKNLQML